MIAHFKRRVSERFCMEISDAEYESLIEQIRSGESVFVRRISRARALHEVELHGTRMLVVYNRDKGLLHTALDCGVSPAFVTQPGQIMSYSGKVWR